MLHAALLTVIRCTCCSTPALLVRCELTIVTPQLAGAAIFIGTVESAHGTSCKCTEVTLNNFIHTVRVFKAHQMASWQSVLTRQCLHV